MTQKTQKVLAAAAIAGILAGATAAMKPVLAADSGKKAEKNACKGKDGCKHKGKCKGEDAKKKHADKNACKGKDGCKGNGSCGEKKKDEGGDPDSK